MIKTIMNDEHPRGERESLIIGVFGGWGTYELLGGWGIVGILAILLTLHYLLVWVEKKEN
jgi:hypothetical protein